MKTYFSDLVGSIVVNELSMTYYKGVEAYNNFQSTKATFPAVFLSMPIEAKFQVRQSGLIEITFIAEMIFANLAALDASSDDHLLIQDTMFEKSLEFVAKFANEDSVRSIGTGTKALTFENAFDANISGVTLHLEFMSSVARAVC